MPHSIFEHVSLISFGVESSRHTTKRAESTTSTVEYAKEEQPRGVEDKISQLGGLVLFSTK